MPYPSPQNDRAPRGKIFILAFVMAGLAGHVNSSMLLGFGLPVSQMTGMASRISEGLARPDMTVVLSASAILIGFIGGATLSGLMIGRHQFPDSPRYAWALATETVLLLLAAAFAARGSTVVALATAAIACGLQNALVASYRGLLIRTTHVTGIVTDIGVHLAKSIRRRGWSWQGSLLLTLLAGYVAGGVGGVASMSLGIAVDLLLPATACAILAVLALIYRHRRRIR